MSKLVEQFAEMVYLMGALRMYSGPVKGLLYWLMRKVLRSAVYGTGGVLGHGTVANNYR